MKKIALVLSIILGTLVSLNTYAKKNEQPLDQIIAVVNDEVITKSELNHSITNLASQLRAENVTLPPQNVMQKQVLEQLINRKLELQVAKQVGVQISDAELDTMLERIAKQNNVSLRGLYEHVSLTGMSTADYRAEMRNQLTVQKLQQQELASKVSITPQEVSAFIKSKSWQISGSKEYRLEDILIPLADGATTTDIVGARKRAEAIRAKIHDGAEFTKAAQANSSGSEALSGGDLGWRKLSEIPTAFAEQVSRMDANQIAGPIQTPNGFHIIRVAEVRGESKEAAPDRKQIEEQLFQQKFEEAMQSWLSKLRSQAFIVNNLEKA